MAQYSKRGRNSNRRRQGGNNNPNRSMDSQGPEVKIRGTATQIYDKYQALARDAASSGDRIRAESLMQHAEHYYRLMKSMQPAERPQERRDQPEGAASADQKPTDQTADQDSSARPPKEEQAASSPPSDESKAETPDDAEAPAAADTSSSDEQSEAEAKPRRRRRRRRTSDDESGSGAAGEEGAASAPAPEEVSAG